MRFTQGNHGSLLDPTDFPAATAEMQGEMASMLVTGALPFRSAIPRSFPHAITSIDKSVFLRRAVFRMARRMTFWACENSVPLLD